MSANFIAWVGLALAPSVWGGTNVNVGRYDTVHIVPAPGPVTIDGDLSDWDTSGEFYTYRFEAEKDIRYVRGVMMYDARHLYIGAHIGDPSPMMNLYDPASEAQVAWRGDCLQVRLSSDPKLGWPLQADSFHRQPDPHIVHLTLWHYTPTGQACLYVQYGMDYHGLTVNPPGFQGAYRKDADGRGFVLEYAISWSLLNAADHPPKGGETMACVWQVLWSDVQGRRHQYDLSEIRNPHNVGFVYQDAGSWGKAVYHARGRLSPGTVVVRSAATAPATEPDIIPIRYTIPGAEPARVSLQVHDSQGRTVRWLLGAAERPAGANVAGWNGLDNDGNPVPPGRYVARWCWHRGVQARLLATADNPGHPPFETGDNTGSWAGDYGTPAAVAATDSHVFIAHENGEASRILIKVTPQGQRLWGVDTTLDLDYGVIAMATDGQDLYVLQGQPLESRGAGPPPPPRRGFVKISCQTGFNVTIGKTGRAFVLVDSPHPLSGIAVNDTHVFVSSEKAGKVYCIDKHTGRVDGTIDLPEPRGLAVGPEGWLYAIAAVDVWKIDPRGRRGRHVLIRDLFQPQQLAVSRRGEVFVSLHGIHHQVVRFDSRGQELNRIGRDGGMLVPGPWVREAMRRPRGLCLDPQGRLWVAEGTSNPKRTSVWEPDGRFVTEYIGPCPYSSGSVIDPTEPEYIYSSNTRFRIDYATGRTEPVAVVFDPPPAEHPPWHPWWPRFTGLTGHAFARFIHFQGRRFVYVGRTGSQLYEMIGDRLVGLVATGRANIGITGQASWRGERDVIGLDRNLDGRIDPPEARLLPCSGGYWGDWITDTLDLYFGDPRQLWLMRCEGFDSRGVPIYQPSQARLLFTARRDQAAQHPQAVLLPADTQIESKMVDREGNIYLLTSNGADRIRRDQGFLDKGHRLAKYSPDLKLVWEYRNLVASHPASRNTVIARPGEIIGAIKLTGEFGRYLTLCSYYGQYHILDKATGLYITAFTPDTRADPPLDGLTVLTENFNGAACYADKLKKYLYCGGDANARVWEILGLDQVVFGETPIQVTAADAEHARLGQRQALGVAQARKLLMVPPRSVQVDGDLAEWADAEWVEFGVDADRRARAAAGWELAHGRARLYVAFDVRDPSPMLNRGGDNHLLFKTGDAVEFCLASAAAEAARPDERPIAGDQRLLIALVQDKPVIVLYEPKSARTDKTPATFRSPTGQETYDHVAVLDSRQASAAIRRQAASYVVELALDAQALGLEAPAVGQVLRADFGVLFSDQGGSRTLTRAMWADDHHELGVNNDIPTESRLHPARWGRLVLR